MGRFKCNMEVPEDLSMAISSHFQRKGYEKNARTGLASHLSIPRSVFSWIFLKRKKREKDQQQREEPDRIKRERHCNDYKTSLRQIMDYTSHCSLFLSLIDVAKAFDSVDRVTLWKYLQYH